MSARFDLTDEEWALIAPLLPQGLRGARRVDDRLVLNDIFIHAAHGLSVARSAGALRVCVLKTTPGRSFRYGQGQIGPTQSSLPTLTGFSIICASHCIRRIRFLAGTGAEAETTPPRHASWIRFFAETTGNRASQPFRPRIGHRPSFIPTRAAAWV